MSRVHSENHPGLERALDPEFVRGSLAEHAAASGVPLQVLDCAVIDVRYRPGGPCWILYRLRLRDGEGRSHRPWLSARLLDRGETPDPVPAPLAARYAALAERVFPEPSFVLPDVPMAVYPFPVDAGLPGLFEASDPGAMKLHLGRLWAERRVRVRKVRVEHRGYTPHARAAFFYEVLSEDKRTGIPEVRRLVGKMHAKKSTPRLFADQWALWSAAGGRLPLAPPVGFIGLAGLTLQEQVRGERLGGMVERPGFGRHVRHAARVLAVLHGVRFPISTRRRVRDEVDTVRRWAGVLRAIRPDLANRIDSLESRLIAAIEERSVPSAVIHADFHHTNVLVDGDDLHLIDFDEMAWGDPMVDVGRFLASLRVPARRAFGDLTALNRIGEGFLEEYLRRAGGDSRRARLFEASALLIAAGSSFRIQRANWAEETGLLIDECERILELALAGAPASIASPSKEDSGIVLAPEERDRWIENGIYMQAVLEPRVRRQYGVELTACRVTASEPSGGDRRVHFHLQGWCGDRRWERTLLGQTGRERGGKSFLARLEAVSAALDAEESAFLLPKPLLYDRHLALMVWDAVDGTRFTSKVLLDGAEGAARRIARAMAGMHRIPVDLDAEWPWERERTQLAERLEMLSRFDPALGARAAATHTLLTERLRHDRTPRSPALRSLHPRHVLLAGERPALERVEDIVAAPAGLDAGDFLARLTLFGLASGNPAAAGRAREAFLEAYRDAEPETGALPAFEAATLLRLAQIRVAKATADPGTLEGLIEAAAERVSAGPGSPGSSR